MTQSKACKQSIDKQAAGMELTKSQQNKLVQAQRLVERAEEILANIQK